MSMDFVRLIVVILRAVIPIGRQAIREKVQALVHGYRYKAVDNPRNVIVIGASFAGIELARKLAHSLPTGYRVVVVERNSHFNYTFNFPRYSVLQGHEQLAFIPYGGVGEGAPEGIFQHIHGEVVEVSKERVMLASGEDIPYAYLVVATGSSQTPPAKLKATDREGASLALRGFQKDIETADKVAVVGGGAVGVELAADVKSYYPEKDVALIHSREQLLPRFGPRLHEHVLAALKNLGIQVILGQRPEVLPQQTINKEKASGKSQSVWFNDGRVTDFDIVISCTGQQPNSSLLANLIPNAVSEDTGRIIVQPTLQISSTGSVPSNIFAIGDIAETGGPKMARAAFFQASVVKENILSLIQGRDPKAHYQPNTAIEGSLKLTLGKVDSVLYCQPNYGREILITSSKGQDDLDIERAWRYHDADIQSVRSALRK